jgi:hypothetical protein
MASEPPKAQTAPERENSFVKEGKMTEAEAMRRVSALSARLYAEQQNLATDQPVDEEERIGSGRMYARRMKAQKQK